MASEHRIATRVGKRETYIQQTGPMELTIWQSMGKFHRIRMSNAGTPMPAATYEKRAQWITKLLTEHASEIRRWFGFSDTQRIDIPWESYERTAWGV